MGKNLNKPRLGKYDKRLPLHSIFWEMDYFDNEVQDIYMSSAAFNTTMLTLTELYKPLLCPFRLNAICHAQQTLKASDELWEK